METIKHYLGSLKSLNLRFVYNLLYDAISIFTFIFVILGFYTIANLIIGTVQRNDTGITGFLILASGLIFAFISSFGVLLVGLSFFKTRVYGSPHFRNLLSFHLKWLPIWGVLYILLSLLVNPIYQGYYLIVGFLVYSIFTYIIRSKLSSNHNNNNHHNPNNNAINFIKQNLKNNISKYLLVLLTFIILSLIGIGLLKVLSLSYLGMFWLFLVYLFTLGFGRHYLAFTE